MNNEIQNADMQTPQNTTSPQALPPAQSLSAGKEPPSPPGPARAGGEDVKLSPVLGQVEVLSEADQAQLFACEEVISNGLANFVQMGLALATIRDKQLYRDYGGFNDYCLKRWEYGRRYVNYLIAAAQLVRALSTNGAQVIPDCERQVRPLIGLPADQVQAAWDKAVQKAGGRKVTGRMVRAVVQELKGSAPAKTAENQPTRAEKRRDLDSRIAELLVLLAQKASYELLAQKVHELQGVVTKLLPVLSASRKGGAV